MNSNERAKVQTAAARLRTMAHACGIVESVRHSRELREVAALLEGVTQ
jgi:hypothetical protein